MLAKPSRAAFACWVGYPVDQGGQSGGAWPLKTEFNGVGGLRTYVSCMDTSAVATIHDHWAEDTVSDHGLVALKLRARHLAKHHPIAMEILEWSFSLGVAFFLLTATLIANAGACVRSDTGAKRQGDMQGQID